jgi:hypothetical protein
MVLRPDKANSSWHPILKILNQKKAGKVTEVVEHLPSQCEALSSNSSTTKKSQAHVIGAKTTE